MAVAEVSDSIEALVNMVMKLAPHPEDSYEIAAILESSGWTDQMAQESFGAGTIFDLAEDVWQVVLARIAVVPVEAPRDKPFLEHIVFMVGSFLRGSMFALPMAICIFAVLILRYALWAYMYFSTEIATSIAMGMILSFMVTGGFTQVIARRGFFYFTQDEHVLARKMSFYFIRLGFIVSMVVGVAFFLFNLIFEVFTWDMMGICLLYYSFLCLTWLSVTVFYMLRRELLFTGMVSAGILFIYILNKFYELYIFLVSPGALTNIPGFAQAMLQLSRGGVIAAVRMLLWQRSFWEFYAMPNMNVIILFQVIGLFLVSLSSLLTTSWIFKEAERKTEAGMAPSTPRMSIVIYTSIPFFLYGFLYFSFLYIDRINAWSANSLYMPYLIWFRGEYELGLDWALLTLIIPMGMAEMFINRFVERLVYHQKLYKADEASDFNKSYLALYRSQIIYYIIAAVISGLLVYFGMLKIQSLHLIDVDLFMNNVTYFVFRWAVVGYVLTAAGLANALFLCCLSRTELAVRSVLFALIVNVIVGFLLSRWVVYYWAVFGLTVGALVFAVVSTISLVDVLKKLDYNIYAAS